TFAKISGPAWLAVAGSGSISGTPANADSGTNIFFVSVTDLGVLSGQARMNLNVIAPINLSIARQGNQLALSWTGGSPPYQIQTRRVLTGGNWSNLGGP